MAKDDFEVFEAATRLKDFRAFATAGDLGGTKARLALYGLNRKDQPELIARANPYFAQAGNFDTVIDSYRQSLKSRKLPFPRKGIVLAAAGIISADGRRCHLTNSDLEVDLDKLKEQGLQAEIINDFFAVAYGVPTVKLSEVRQISRGYEEKREQGLAILPYPTGVEGPGTGLGVGKLGFDPKTGKRMAEASEGGHITFSAENEMQDKLYFFLRQNVTAGRAPDLELVASGKGIYYITQFLAKGDLPTGREYAQTNRVIEKARANPEWRKFIRNLEKTEIAQAGIDIRKAYESKFFQGVLDNVIELFACGLGQSIRQIANAFACYDGGIFIAGGNARRFGKQIATSNGFHYAVEHSYPNFHEARIKTMPLFLVEGEACKHLGTMGAAVRSFENQGLVG